ncbi:MAG: type II secretion system F family protein [Alphaproteobacteria bacterium]|nr:type II secretion system F family protein [Alphaproteobacteria bacterium]
MFDIPLTGIPRLAFLTIVFLVVVMGVVLFNSLVVNRVAVRRRLDTIAHAGEPALFQGGSLRTQKSNSAWVMLIDQIEKRGISLVDTNQESLRTKMIAAGYTSKEAPRFFTLIRLVMTLLLPGIFLVFSMLSSEPPSVMKLYVFGAALACFGLYAPNLFIAAKTARRREEIVNGFPDALDLMLVCVEAGLGLEAAFDRVGREMTLSHPLVADMLGSVVLELRAGRSREEALRRMSDRIQVDEIRAFATLLIQSEKLGSSVGQTLRVYAAEMREKRRLRAEEKAHRLPVLLSIPLVTCMLPVMIGVLMLPAVIRVIRVLLPAMAH